MKGQMKVKKLNDTGLYISEMDWDNTYICKENPIGNFVMVIEPLSGFDGGIIYFENYSFFAVVGTGMREGT